MAKAKGSLEFWKVNRMRFTKIALTIIIVVGLGSGWAVSAQTIDPSSVKEPPASPEINLGKMAYQAFCQECHGVNGVGTDKGPPFLHKVYHPGHHGDQSFYNAALKGARGHHWKFGDMKPVEGVKENHVKSIIAYVRALQKVNGIW